MKKIITLVAVIVIALIVGASISSNEIVRKRIVYSVPVSLGTFRYEIVQRDQSLFVEQVLGKTEGKFNIFDALTGEVTLSSEKIAEVQGSCKLLSEQERVLEYTIQEMLCEHDGTSILYVLNRYEFENGEQVIPPGHEPIAKRFIVGEVWSTVDGAEVSRENLARTEVIYDQPARQIRE